MTKKVDDEEKWLTKKVYWQRKMIDEEDKLMKKVVWKESWLTKKVDWLRKSRESTDVDLSKNRKIVCLDNIWK